MNASMRTQLFVALACLWFVASEAQAGVLRNPSATTVALWYHLLNGHEVPWEDWAKGTFEYRSANDFQKPKVLRDQVAKLKDQYESLKTADTVEVFSSTVLSSYDMERGCYYLTLFDANTYWPFHSELDPFKNYIIELENSKEFHEWKIPAERAEKLFPTGGNVTVHVTMKVLRAEEGGMGEYGGLALIGHGQTVELLGAGDQRPLDTLQEKSHASGAVVPAKRTEEPALYDIRGIRVGQNVGQVMAAAEKEGLKLAMVDGQDVSANPPKQVPNDTLRLVFYTGTFAYAGQFSRPTSPEQLAKLARMDFDAVQLATRGQPINHRGLEAVAIGSTRAIVRFTADPCGPAQPGQVLTVKYEQAFPFLESYAGQEFSQGVSDDLIATYGVPTKRRSLIRGGFGWDWGEEGESWVEKHTVDIAPFTASMDVFVNTPIEAADLPYHNDSRAVKPTGYLVTLTAEPVKPKAAPTPPAPTGPTRLFGRSAPVPTVAAPETAPPPTPRPRLFAPTTASAPVENGASSAPAPSAPAGAAMTYQAADAHLNRAYATLRDHLSVSGKKSLIVEQRNWLMQRDAIVNPDNRTRFVEQRAQEIDQRVQAGAH